MIKKTFASEIKQIGDESERVLRFTTSTESEDRDGDIIEVNGWKLDNYLKNPVILYGHNYEGLPVGRSISVQKDTVNKKLIQDVKFPTKEEYEFGDTVYRLVKAGYLNATSVGFINIQSEPRLDEKGNYLGKKYKKQELLETSIVPVPSNPTALMEARSKGIINDNELKMFEEAKDVIVKPGWDETETSFRFRVREPGLFQEGTFRTVPIKKDKPRVNSVMGRLKGEDSMTVQSVIFPKDDGWDLSEAKAWLKEHEDLTKGVDDMEEKEPDETIKKTGATISSKNRATMTKAIGYMQSAIEMMSELLGEEPKTFKPEDIGIKEVAKQDLQKDAPKAINLDAIEFPKNDLDISQKEIKELITEIINTQIKGGN